jgi:hypothetical protein
MELFDNLALGFGVAFTFQNLIYAFIGCLLGTLIGVLPGVGPVATIAMLLPATYALPPVAALIMLAGIYYGAQYGGSTTAILVNLPGEASSVVTMIDGYQMARKGRAGPALAAAGLGSFFAGCVGTLILAAFAGPLTEVAFKFGPAEYFSLIRAMRFGKIDPRKTIADQTASFDDPTRVAFDLAKLAVRQSGCDHVAKRSPVSDRWKLVNIADQQSETTRCSSSEDRKHDRKIVHGCLVDHDQPIRKRVLFVP